MDDASFGDSPIVYACNAAALKRTAGGCVDSPDYRFEAAGSGFARRYEVFVNKTARPKLQDDESSEEEEYGKENRKSPKDKSTGGCLKMSDLIKGVNLYELLCVSEGAVQDEIKKAYRTLCLSAHPDKVSVLDPQESKQVQEKFVMIQEAYELLSDPAKRMQYDSTLDFDDSLPKFRPSEGADFYQVLGEAFKRNARFAVRRPVPDIGGPETKLDDVKKFYNYWHDFQSWRDPVVLAQQNGEEICDLAEAECREEKRWMVRENARVARAYKQAERDRIAALVATAEKFDPRLLAEKEAKKEARQAEAKRREEERTALQRLKEEEEQKRRAAEEAEHAVEEQRRKEEKAAREAVKERVKKCRQRIRGFYAAVKDAVVLEQLNEVCLQLEESALRALGDKVEAALKKSPATAVEVLHRAIESIGLKPIQPKLDDDEASTSSGPTQSSTPSEEQAQAKADARREERLKKQSDAQYQAQKAAAEAAAEAERARVNAEKAEERKKREEQKRKELAAAEVKRRQLEKKEDEKAKKAVDKQKKQGEVEEQKKVQQREESKLRSQEQAERDRAAAQLAKEEAEQERLVQLFSSDRLERLSKLDPMTDEAILATLRSAVEEDAALAGALKLMKGSGEASSELALDRYMALVYTVGVLWPLGLVAPTAIKLPNDLRNRVKKARLRLRNVFTTFLASAKLQDADESMASDWQSGIVDGSIEPPTWSPQEREAEAAAQQRRDTQAAQKAASVQAPSGKKVKAKGAPEEDLDKLLAEFGMAPQESKKGGKKKK